jgi:hypothetical protein
LVEKLWPDGRVPERTRDSISLHKWREAEEVWRRKRNKEKGGG